MKIAIFSNYRDMESDFADLSTSLNCELIFRFVPISLLNKTAIQMERAEQVNAIIESDGYADQIQEYVTVPVLTQRISSANIIEAVYKASKYGPNILYVEISAQSKQFKNTMNIETIAEICHCHVEKMTVNDTEDFNAREETLKSYDSVVSYNEYILEAARRMNKKTVQILPDRQSLTTTIENALRLVKLQEYESRRIGFSRSMINAIPEGAFTLNESDKINIINSAAEKILGCSSYDILGLTMKELCEKYPWLEPLLSITEEPNIVKLRGYNIIANRSYLCNDKDKVIGKFYYLQETQYVKEQALLMRKKTRESGFVATKSFADIIGKSPIIQRTINTAKSYALTSSNILILGESGTGKDIFAQSIHNHSEYSNGPFVAINCASLPENLLEAELFGYEEGAFTGASKGGKLGLFEIASGGTLFLDEIGEMPLALQSKFLRALENKSIRRIGGQKNISINVRIICATNRNLAEEVEKGNFRSDLYYRLDVLQFRIPPLRDRKEDVPLLASQFLEQFGKKNSHYCRFSTEACKVLQDYDWPGNIRELSNVIERVVALSENDSIIDAKRVTEAIDTGQSKNIVSVDAQNSSVDENVLQVPIGTMKEMKNDIINQLLKQYKGDKKKVAYILDISSSTMWRHSKE